MAYLFDTDTVSATFRRSPDLGLIRRLAAVPASDQFISAITLGELVFGAVRRNRQDLLERIAQLLEHIPVLPFDQAAARVFGQVKADLERRGTSVSEPDLRIAAIALARDLTVISGNERHFRLVRELRLENWLSTAKRRSD
jgi:tRNA(fMet)-specific endonuclease VapC